MKITVDKPVKVEVVGEHEVVKRSSVAFKLSALRDLIEPGSEILGLDVSDGHWTVIRPFAYDEVGSAIDDSTRLVCCGHARVDSLDQRFQRWAIRMLRGVAASSGLEDVADVLRCNGRWHARRSGGLEDATNSANARSPCSDDRNRRTLVASG